MRALLIVLFCLINVDIYAVSDAAALKVAADADIDNDYPTGLGNNELSYGRCSDIPDPMEKLNRRVFMFNSVLDHFILKPIARGYRNMLSEETRGKVGNVLDNLQVPLTTVNNTLQIDGKNALLSFWQFAINSTLGVGGIEDVARKRGLHVEPQTLGSTLASYGVGPGPYVVLPFFGGSGARDMFDSPIANSAMNPLSYEMRRRVRLAITASRLVHERSEILPFTDNIEKTSPDAYVAIRSSIHQAREKTVHYPTYYRCHHD